METHILLIVVALLGVANILIAHNSASKLDQVLDAIAKIGSAPVTPDSVCKGCKHTFSEHDDGVIGGCHGRSPGGKCWCDINGFQPWRC